jgi:hypothetical protein
MALGTPVAGTVAYSAQNGSTVSAPFPAGIVAGDALVAIYAFKNTTNVGSFTPPPGFVLQIDTGGGGYASGGNDVGDTRLFFCTKTAVGNESGTNAVGNVAGSNIAWGCVIRIPSSGGPLSYQSGSGVQDTTPGTTLSAIVSTFPTDWNLAAGDALISAMSIPTDVTTPDQFSNHTLTYPGATIAAVTELREPDTATGSDMGGFITETRVNSVEFVPTSNKFFTLTTAVAGTRTNVRGPIIVLRVREAQAAAPSANMLLMF